MIKGTALLGDHLALVFLIFPSFCLTESLFLDGALSDVINVRTLLKDNLDPNLWVLKNMSGICVALVIHSVFWTIILVLIESGALLHCKAMKKKSIKKYPLKVQKEDK